jgi:hypothetical protein
MIQVRRGLTAACIWLPSRRASGASVVLREAHLESSDRDTKNSTSRFQRLLKRKLLKRLAG